VNRVRAYGTPVGPFEVVLLAAGALLALLEGGLWLWTGLTGALFGSGWPHLTLGILWHAASGVARHLSDPRQGFPRSVRAGLPGPAAFYATLLLLATLAGLVIAGAVRLLERHRTGGRSKHDGARWARAGDLLPLRRARRGRRETSSLDSEQAGPRKPALGLSLGYQSLRLLRAEERHALVVFGPTQSGKSAGIAISNILEWTGPAIVVSIKPDLLDATITARSQRGEVFAYDPFALWDEPSHTWSPLASASTWNGALETAQRMALPGRWTPARSKAGASGPKPPSSAWPPCCTPPRALAEGWLRSSNGCTGRAVPSSTASCTSSPIKAAARTSAPTRSRPTTRLRRELLL
jgi:type IV secretion system protein VirD4